jgi:cellulose synthase/poly-beta-1,6-N-acetylglucosamine synthase-like glycosyltransferase
MIAAITLTGDREEAFGLCRRWMENQTVQPYTWIVVDDGKTKMKSVPKNCLYIRREPQTSDPKHTLILNMKEALKVLDAEYIVIMEDDEYYAPDYISQMLNRLIRYEITGIGRSKYYHLQGGFIRHMNLNHASLAQTAFRKSLLPEFKTLLNGDSFLDLRMWEIFNGKDTPLCNAFNLQEKSRITKDGRGIIFDDAGNCFYVGIKGMVGRTGIGGSGHKFSGYTLDKNFVKLKEWLGDDFKHYQKYLKGG